MRSLVLIAGLFALAASAPGATYRWVDRNGVVHYSDRPAPGAVLIETREAQTFTVPQLPGELANALPGAAASAEEPYRSLEIFRPGNDETLVNTGNQVSVRLRLEPDLRRGHSIWIYLDGKRVDGLPTSGDEFTLTGVFRGTHTLNAIVADAQGNPQIRSPSITFHLRQTSVLTPRPGS